MRKFRISVSIMVCLVLLGFSGNVYGQSDSLKQLFRSYQNFFENHPTIDYPTNSERIQNQINPNSDRINSRSRFIYFFNDSIVFGNKIKLKTPFLSRNKFVVDDKVYFANRVKFYNADGSFKANKHKKRRSPRFIQRVSTGVINVYAKEYKTQVPHYGYSHYSGITPNYSGREQTVLIQYYNFGYGDLKKASYRNLKRDIGHCPESMKCLNEYKKDNRIENLVIFSAAGLIITSIIMKNTVGAIGLYLGLGALNVAALVIASNSKEGHLRDAMYRYHNK